MKSEREPVFFLDAAAFRAWLERHGANAAELVVGFYKVGSGQPSITWPESVDEALCFGWIDGVRKRIDDDAYQIRFSPRQAGSIWSRVNIARALALIAEGRMRPAGLRAFERRIERKSAAYSYEQEGKLVLAPDELRRFRSHRKAWAFFERVAPSYRKAITHWVVSAKRPETRARRFEELVEACATERKLLK